MSFCEKINQAGQGQTDAPWRTDRVTDVQFLQKMLARGKVCPLLSLRGFSKARFRRDWLHGADLGVGADFLGNVFEHLMHSMPGPNRAAKCSALWRLINVYYNENHITDRLLSFSYKSFKQGKSQPKLRGGAAMVRKLIPFAENACVQHLDASNAFDATVIEAARWLHRCYMCLRHDHADWETELPLAARMFCNNYVALHTSSGGERWRPKPKLHYFLELCSDGSKPSRNWTYRDEEFGGSWSGMSRRRGGRRGPTAQSAMAIANWRASQDLPRIV